jgi:hypothetical protein
VGQNGGVAARSGDSLRRYSERRLEYLTDLFSAPGPIRPRLKGAMTVLAGVGEHRRGCVMVNAAAELGTAATRLKSPAMRALLSELGTIGSRRIRLVSRPASAAPATGSSKRHAQEQRKLIDEALEK